MSKILSCWFWTPKTKPCSKKENSCFQNSYAQTDHKLERHLSIGHVVEPDVFCVPVNSKKVCSLSDKPFYFEKISSSITQNKIQKSYPVSPRKSLLKDIKYFSDQNLQRMPNHKLNEKYTPLVYAASTHQNSTINRPRATLGSNEPFPFDVPKDTAPRQSLFYELRYGSTDDPTNVTRSSRYEAEKPMEDYNKHTTIENDRFSKSYDQNHLNKENDSSNERKSTHVAPACIRISSREPVKPISIKRGNIVIAPNQKLVHQFQLKPKNKTPVLMTGEGKILHPLHKNKLRSNSLQANKEKPSVRVSVVQPQHFELEEDASSIPVRKSFRRTSTRQSIQPIERFQVEENTSPIPVRKNFRQSIQSASYRGDLETEQFEKLSLPTNRNNSFVSMKGGESEKKDPYEALRGASCEELATDNGENNIEGQSFFFANTGNKPVVYAVPVVPTRGRSKSMLQNSVKSKNLIEPVIRQKNVRYSVDTDVFSAHARRISVSPTTQGFVSMERGQAMLVSEALNPITSLFISDLKTPIPKDPLSKPKEANVWVKPRRSSVQQNSLPKQPSKPSTRIQTVTYDSRTQKRLNVPIQRRLSRRSYYKYQDESSSSDESVVMYRKKSKHSAPKRSYHHAVYAAEIPNSFPYYESNDRDRYKSEGKEQQMHMAQTSSSNDLCGLTLGKSQSQFFNLNSPRNVQFVSSSQQTDEDELDLVCYPSESVLKKSVVSSASGSKLRWRIIIKRGDEK